MRSIQYRRRRLFARRQINERQRPCNVCRSPLRQFVLRNVPNHIAVRSARKFGFAHFTVRVRRTFQRFWIGISGYNCVECAVACCCCTGEYGGRNFLKRSDKRCKMHFNIVREIRKRLLGLARIVLIVFIRVLLHLVAHYHNVRIVCVVAAYYAFI